MLGIRIYSLEGSRLKSQLCENIVKSTIGISQYQKTGPPFLQCGFFWEVNNWGIYYILYVSLDMQASPQVFDGIWTLKTCPKKTSTLPGCLEFDPA